MPSDVRYSIGSVLFVAAIVLLLGIVVLLFKPGQPIAGQAGVFVGPSVTRTLSSDTIAPEEYLTVFLHVEPDEGNIYAIDELIPAGFIVDDAGGASVEDTGHLKWLYVSESVPASPTVLAYRLFALPDSVGMNVLTGSYQFQSSSGSMQITGSAYVNVSDDGGTILDCSGVSYLMDYDNDKVISLTDVQVFNAYYIVDDIRADVDNDSIVTKGDYICFAGYASGNLEFPPSTPDCSLECAPYVPFCGDGHKDAGEQCDGSVPSGITCQSAGYVSGTLSCSSCTLNFNGCVKKNTAPPTKPPKDKIATI
ncbi:MAG: hypothetical protein ABIA93_04970 [Candidatus Woesearchaeota archaeon]